MAYDGEIKVGMRFIWEPTDPHARVRVIVTEINCSGPDDGPGGERWIRSSENSAVGGAWNEEDRFREACVLEESRVTDDMVERATMKLLGHDKDPASGIDWHCNRQWTVAKVRKLMREALNEVC